MPDEKKTRVVTVRLAEDVHTALVDLARAERRKLATLVGLILEDFVAGKAVGRTKAGDRRGGHRGKG